MVSILLCIVIVWLVFLFYNEKSWIGSVLILYCCCIIFRLGMAILFVGFCKSCWIEVIGYSSYQFELGSINDAFEYMSISIHTCLFLHFMHKCRTTCLRALIQRLCLRFVLLDLEVVVD